MANPAELLHATFMGWQEGAKASSRTVEGARGLTTDRTAALLTHELAMHHITQIRDLMPMLGAMNGPASTTVYENAIPKWTEMVLSYRQGWSSTNAKLNQSSIDLLATLGPHLAQLCPLVEAPTREKLRGAIEQLTELVRTSELADPIKLHLTGLISHMRTCLDEYEVRGDFDLQRAVLLLRGVAEAGYDHATNEDRPRWRRAINDLVIPTTVTSAATVIGNFVSYLALGS